MQNIEQISVLDRNILHRPAVDTDKIKGTMLLLHGYGADEYDLMGVASYFDANLQIFSVRGPRLTPYGGASWFDIDMLADGSLQFNTDQALESAKGIVALIDEMRKLEIVADEKLVLAGFSQGATISNLVTLLNPEIIKALLIMSGRLAEQAMIFVDRPDNWNDIPVFAGHGTHDNVIPIEFGRELVSFWSKLPVLLEHHEYPMGHEISQDELGHIQNWLNQLNW